MQAIILCGGQGTRLKEETEYKPKPMVKIGNAPILWHIMQIYAGYGFTEFVLALGFKGESIRDFFLNYEFYNNDFTIRLGKHKDIKIHENSDGEPDWKITLAETGENTMTGSRVKLCERHINGKYFFVTYGDGLADVDLEKLLKFHKAHGKIATLTGVNPPSRWGEVAVDGNRAVKFTEKPAASEGDHCVNGGFFVFSREAFKYFSSDGGCVLEADALRELADDGELMVFRHDGFWQGMDTYRDYLALNKIWDSGNPAWIRPRKSAKFELSSAKK